MSLTAFQRYRRMKQVEEMKPENIIKAQEEAKEKSMVPEEVVEENFKEEPLVPDEEVKEEKKETKTATRRNNKK